MAPTAIAPWEPFPIQSPSSPSLYLQRQFTETSYAVYLTDLTSIWTESLEKGAICDRAEDRNCSIDPSTDDSQFHILLEKLSSGITGLNPAVSVDLEVRGDTFNINTNEKLQAPLQPLEWRFRLKLQPAAQFTKHFSLPLLYYGSLLSRQTSSLLNVIEEKDVTIARLLDKFEEYKIDISTAFPGYKKGRTPTGKARGVVPFDRDDWRREVLAAETDTKISTELVKATFKQLSRKDVKLEATLPKPSDVQWWTKLSGKTRIKGDPEVEPTPHTTPRKPKLVKLNTDSDDDFKALPSSPVRAKAGDESKDGKKEANPAKPAINDDTTEDEDDLDVAPKSQNSEVGTNKSSQPTPPPPRRYTESTSPKRSTTLSTSPKPTKKETSDDNKTFEKNWGNQFDFLDTMVDGDTTTSDSDDAGTKPKAKATSKKPSGIKKTIGGKKQQQKPIQPVMSDSDGEGTAPAPESKLESEPPKRLGKIKGTIGGRKAGGEPPKRKEPEPDSDVRAYFFPFR
ncbi:hypothetical protein ABW20_dc0110086 [Dactylellina cionopaga]|nr:hypothetical protein ABW20_dc0110086 [Dactylellina cionopaga]